MSRWFRLYDDTINDPKVIMMPEPMRWHWVAILCVASKNQGVLPEISDVAFGLRVSEKKAKSIVDDLVARRLLDKIDDVLVPHNWSGRQYQSDSSAQRVKRHREKRTAAGLGVHAGLFQSAVLLSRHCAGSAVCAFQRPSLPPP